MEILPAIVWIMMATKYTTICARSTGCVNSCDSQIDGNYQYCPNCHQYVACSNGNKYIMQCPNILVWDDVLKRCELTSSTCISTTIRIPSVTVEPPLGCGADIATAKRVTRGPTWEWDDQDGGAGKLGTVNWLFRDNWWNVTWDVGHTNYYRMGEGFQDLCVL